MSKIKVLQFRIYGVFGGMERYMINNWHHIDKTRFEFDFFTITEIIPQIIENTDIPLDNIVTPKYKHNVDRDKYIEDVKAIFDRGKYDAIHFHNCLWTGTLMEELACEHNIRKIIVHSHSAGLDLDRDCSMKQMSVHKNIRKTVNYNIATDFCACSSLAADWLFGEQIPRDNIKIMKNAIEVEKFIYNKNIRDKYRKDLGFEDCFVIGNVGRMTYQKNHEFLIDVFNEVSKKITSARLLIVGNGELKDNIKSKVEKLGLTDKIIFLESRNDVNDIMQAMDVFCLPSRFEGLGIVLIEAQSSGLKSIASDVLPVEAKITANVDFLPLDVDKWVDNIVAISKGYERKNMYDEITSAGYNINYQIKQIEKLYRGDL